MKLRRKADTPSPGNQYSLLMLEIPRTNDKKELSAEQMLAALHGILRTKKEIRYDGGMQDHISLEIVAIQQRIRMYIWCAKQYVPFVEGQLYAQYPTVQIYEQTEDYSMRNMDQSVLYSSELVLTDHETLPVKTFPSFEVDPLAAITATLAKLDQQDEEIWIQVMARPISDDWHKRGAKMVKKIKGGGGSGFGSFVGQAFTALVAPPSSTAKPAAPEISERDKTRITAIEEKSRKLGYQVKIRIMYAGHDQGLAKLRMQAIHGAFKQFNTTNLNGFKSKGASFRRDALDEYRARFFIDNGYILNIEELASIFHLPHTSVETPNIVWATTKTAEPPANIPVVTPGKEKDVSLFGVTNFRGTNTVFGANRADRGRHIYVIGQTGTGKTGLMELLTMSDIFYDQGFCVIDPHGDYAQKMLQFIPQRRIDQVVYFNPADTAFPIGFNPLEVTDPTFKTHISSELVGVLKRMFDSWGPRLEYILRYTILALLDYPNATMLDITRMLVEKKFRDNVISYVSDPVVKTFWVTEFASWNEKFASEAVAPVLNKIGAFTANPMIRNIVGQPKSTFNIRKIMDEGKILIVNLSRGLVGEDNAAILGALMVTKIQLAAMSRADMPLDDRRPFYLYVDEFQNFATDSFAVILSEARKYGLNLAIANQYVSQVEDVVRDAVYGNVGTMATFRVGADDATFLSKYYAPQFEPTDLMTMHNRHFVTTMTINGEKSSPFSGSTLQQPPVQLDLSDKIIELSRQRDCVPKAVIEAQIREAIMGQQAGNSTPVPPQSHNKGKQPSVTEVIAQHLRQSIEETTRPTGTQAPQHHQSQPAQPQQANPAPVHQSTQNQPAEGAGKKRTRTRRGKKRTEQNDTNSEHRQPQSNQAQTAPKSAEHEQTIRLR